MTDIATIGFRADTRGLLQAEKGLGRVEKAGRGVDDQLMTVRNTMRLVGAAFAAIGISSLTSELVTYSDAWKLVNNQIRQITGSEKELVSVRQELLGISRATNSEIGVTVDLYSNLYRSTRSLGLAQADVADITRTINNLFLAGGKAAAETAGAVRQLGQGLAAGALRGDEFNAVAEGAPRIMDALAVKLRMTRGELREFASTGGITAEILTSALLEYSDEAQRMADISERTFGQAMVNARTNVTEFVGGLTGLNSAVSRSGHVIEGFTASLADNQDEIILVGSLLGTAALAYAGLQASILIASGATIAYTATLAAFSAQAALTTASVLTLKGALGLLAAAGAAFVAGWQVGSYLREEFEGVERMGIALAAGIHRIFATLQGDLQIVGEHISYALTNPLDFARTKIIDFFTWLAGLGEGALNLLGLGDAMDGITDKLDSWRPKTEKAFKDSIETIRKQTQKEVAGIDDIYADMFANVGKESEKAGKALSEAIGKEAAPAIVKSAEEVKTALSLVMAELEKAQSVDEFGFSGNEDPFNSATWVKQADEVAFAWGDAFSAIQNGLGEVQSTMADGSKEAQKLGQAMQALQVVQGIAAILNQGMGDPYTAIGRMAAMAASVASLIGSVGFAGGASTAAADAQATQGTGSVFGDSEAKSESISKAVELTASTNEKLVAINTGMASSLKAMQDGISSAIGNILRGGNGFAGAGEGKTLAQITGGSLGETFSDPVEALTGVSLDFVGDWLGKALGGSSDVINEGILIAGGRISDLIDSTLVSAFQDVEEKKHFLDDKDVRRATETLGDAASAQFSMIFESMASTVTEAGLALGIAGTELESRINAFQIAATEISFKDLEGAEQQAELEAVFSKIFDGLAASVVPQLGSLAKVGEGYAETLVRVATQVQVAEQAVSQLGIAFGEGLSPVDLARASDELINLGGGLEEFIGKMQSFVSAFATDAHKLDVATNSINAAFSQLGLGAVPQSEEALWALMGTLTDPAEINGLLNLTDAFKVYFDALEDAEQAAEQAAAAEQQLAEERARTFTAETDAALQSLRAAIDSQIAASTANYDQASSAIDADYDRRVAQANSWLDTQLSYFDRSIERVSDSISGLSQLSGQIASAMNANVAQSDALTLMRRTAGQSAIQAALETARAGGNVGDISGALSAVSTDVSGQFGSLFEEQRDQARTANALAELGTITDSQLSAAERTLASLESRKEQAQSHNQRLLDSYAADRYEQQAELTAIYDSTVAGYEAIYTSAVDQINSLRGIETGVLTLDEAVDDLQDAMINEFANESVVLQQQQNELIASLIAKIDTLTDQSAQFDRQLVDYAQTTANETRRRNLLDDEQQGAA